jgi:hypothetical protein
MLMCDSVSVSTVQYLPCTVSINVRAGSCRGHDVDYVSTIVLFAQDNQVLKQRKEKK